MSKTDVKPSPGRLIHLARIYKKGQEARRKYNDDHSAKGQPERDGYGEMEDDEKEAYKRGFNDG
ncbi:hypothetical protein [Pacificoceanicola onchidii]|uniref:hypothetical protein n=1 Tax=Pacificoceanicola onchidii TaxID=2562685 RepID=UPI0010A49139|nr:hypothetical protein [Pacificoceanicola onchidii]